MERGGRRERSGTSDAKAGGVLKLAGPGTGSQPALGVARLNARTRPLPNPTDRYSGLRLGRGARSRGQRNSHRDVSKPHRGGETDGEKGQNRNMQTGEGACKPRGL